MDRVNLYGTFIQLIYTTHLYDSFIQRDAFNMVTYTSDLYSMTLYYMECR